MSKNITNNQRPTINVIDSVSSAPFALKGNSSDGSLNVNITSGGSGGTQYAELITTSPATGTVALGRYKTAAPTLTDGQLYGLQLDSSGNLKVTGSLSVGGTTDNTAFTAGTSTGTPTMGFYHSTIDTVTDGRAAAVGITPKRAMLVNLQTAAGVETGIAAAPLQVSLANTGANTSKILVTPDSVALPANQSVNISQINAVTPLMGNGLTGTGSLRVTIASDNTAFSVNSTLSAETTKVIGTVRLADGSGNLITSSGNALSVDTELPAAAAAADGAANPTAPFAQAANSVYNGTTWDRMREVVDATNSTGTGITAVGNLAQYDDTSPTITSENQFGNLRMTSYRSLHTNLRNNSGTEIGTTLNPLIIDDLAGDLSTISGQPVATSVPGVILTTLAGESGDMVGTYDNRLMVHTRGAQDATEYTVPTVSYFNAALSNTIQLVKSGRTNLYFINIYNPNSITAFVQVFDIPFGRVILGASLPSEVWTIPAGGIFEEVFMVPLAYLNNLQIVATTTSTGSTAPTTGLLVNLRTTA